MPCDSFAKNFRLYPPFSREHRAEPMTDDHHAKENPRRSANDDIIELTEVVAMPDQADDRIIELTDVVESDATEADPIIELTDVVDPAGGADQVIDLTEVVAAPEDEDEAIIELTEIVKPATEDAAADVSENADGELSFADTDLEVEETGEEGLFESLGMSLEADFHGAEDESDSLDFNLSTQELSDAIDMLDAKLSEEPEPAASREDVREMPADIASDKLEKAIENVIRRMFGEKIDRLLNAAIEKTVSAEIATLKAQLLKDMPED
jgi:hypothetical protein